MTDQVFRAASLFPCSASELYAWHSRPGALERLIPPWENTTVVSRRGGIDPGGQVVMRLHAGPIPYHWHARHIENQPGRMFRDIQERGPFARWTHTHRFSDTPEGALLEDQIKYALPAQPLLPGWTTALVTRSCSGPLSIATPPCEDDILLHGRCSATPLAHPHQRRQRRARLGPAAAADHRRPRGLDPGPAPARSQPERNLLEPGSGSTQPGRVCPPLTGSSIWPATTSARAAGPMPRNGG